MLGSILIKILANAGALWIAAKYISGFSIAPVEFVSLGALSIPPLAPTLIVGGLALAILNAVLYPLAKVFGAVIPLVTAAMLSVAANIIILYFAAIYLPQVEISGLKPLFLSGLLIGLINAIL